MANRITGMYSGLDTESLIQDLMKARRTKSEKLTKTQTKTEWKQEKWKTLNTKLSNLMSNTVSALRWSTTYQKKKTSVSNTNAVSVITGEGAMNSVQNLSIKKLASSGYLTGAEVSSASGEKLTASSKMSDLSFVGSTISGSGSFSVTVGDETTTIKVGADTTISDVVSQLNSAGVSANFDEANQRLFIGAKSSGEKADFTITADDSNGNQALSLLGINAGVSSSAAAQYSEIASYSSSLVYDGEGNFDAEATITKLQSDTSSDAYKKFMSLAKENYSKEVSAAQSEYNTLKSEVDTLQKRVDELEKKDSLTDDETAELADKKSQIESKNAELETKKTDLDDMKTNLSGGVYSTEATLEAVNTLKNQVEYAGSVSSSDTSMVNSGAIRLTGADAEIELNGATFKSATNNVTVNGLTFTCNAVADNITVTTQEDTDGVYDVVKNFITEYNSIINEIDKLYNADSTTVEPLTDEERDAVSDTEATKLENQVKDALLRRDETLGNIFNGLKGVMSSGFEVGDKTFYLSDFGISTGSYFSTSDGERNAYHIDGNSEDSVSSGNADKLKSMIATDSETVIDFFTQLGKSLYSKMQDLSASSSYSSFGSFYDDKRIKSDLSDIKDKITKAEEELADYEDKYYAKFSAMEVALSKMESKNSYISSLFSS